MNIFSRGIRNAFRNSVRTISIVVILGLSIGLSLTMLVARQAVTQKISDVKSSIGNTITIAPAGYNSFSSANNALTTTQLAKVQSLAHVSSVSESLTDRLTTIGSTQPSFGGFGGNSSATTTTTTTNDQTSLTSPVTLNSGSGGGGGGGRFFSGGSGSLPSNFSLPISIVGTTTPTSVDGSTLSISSGQALSGTNDVNDAMISKSMASKNSLSVGKTFTAYGDTMTVTGIFTSSTTAGSDDVIVSLATEQRLSGQTGDVTSAVATVDSLDNLSSVTTAIKSSLGSSADVTNSQTEANDAIAPLNSVKTVSLFSLIGAVVAASIIILLTMIMIVRERRREIGVTKAIGGSNLGIMSQFMVEAVTLTILGAVIGLIIGVVGGQPVTKLLVNNSSTTTTTTTTQTGGGGFGGGGGAGGPTASTRTTGGFSRRLDNNGAVSGLKNIHATVGWSILLYGLGAAVLIAVIGSAIASGLIAKIRPAEVMRVE
jgi:putative ABC transport system permease protein